MCNLIVTGVLMLATTSFRQRDNFSVKSYNKYICVTFIIIESFKNLVSICQQKMFWMQAFKASKKLTQFLWTNTEKCDIVNSQKR